MIVYIDISQLERARSNTGIQRVLKEFLQRMVLEGSGLDIRVVSHNATSNKLELIDNSEIIPFLNDVQHYQFQKRDPIDLENTPVIGKPIFFDIDSVWSVELKREKLYPKLKANGFLIFNFLHDLIPLVMPSVVHEVTIMHFEPFLDAVYQYSDMVFFNSHSSKQDFLERKEFLKIGRNIPSRVLGLGSDFLELSGSFDRSFADNILSKKYLLFVGTIEPRKNQKEMLDAFEILAKKYPDLHLVFIGKEGWNVEKLAQRIKSHPLKDTQLHWFSNIDDNLLKQFYKNAFIVAYLSKYEGYGLPIVESLQFGNITITSKNSSMLEAGRNFADYIVYNTNNEIVDTISLYYDNIALYHAKKSHIKQNFKVLTWNTVYSSLIGVLNNYEKAEELRKNKKNELKKVKKELQFIFISISFESIEKTIKLIDKYMDFVKEYIIITHPTLVDKFKELNSYKKIIIIDETNILKTHKKDFHLRDHQSKNWLLRVSLVNLETLDNEFIMLDDDSRPLKKIHFEFFISKNGCYNAYYFYNLMEWNYKNTAYDLGQHSTKSILTTKNYELFSYSVHAPQIINRKIFQEVAEKFFEIGLKKPIDEWSIYFNYAISSYPSLFSQNIFQTLNWPNTPLSWEYHFIPPGYSFENYYEGEYSNELFKEETTFEEKIEIKNKEIRPYINSKKLFENNISMLSKNNMAHGRFIFKKENLELYLFGIPYLVVVEKLSDIRLKINYKLLNPDEIFYEIVIAVLLFGKPRTYLRLQELNNKNYQEGIVELPIISQDLSSILEEYPLPSELLAEGMYNISFDLIVNKEYVYGKKPPYLTKLMIVNRKKIINYLKIKPKSNKIKTKKIINILKLKEKIKNIPFVGWFSRWTNNILRINRLAAQHHELVGQYRELVGQHHELVGQHHELVGQHQNISHLLEKIEREQAKIDSLINENNKNTKLQISKEISTQSLLFQQRIEEFIGQNKDLSVGKKESLKQKTASFILDDFYLSFENRFRGEREEIENRYKNYLKYLNNDIKTALDIGCGRGEWVGLLQKNAIKAEGIDLNFAMLNDASSHGIKNLQKIDAFDFFKNCSDNSFDLISAFHIIEHIPYEQLFIFLQEIKRISTPNAIILLETPNPANLLVAAFEFYKDPTHLNPLPSDVMQFTVEYMGFLDVKIKKLHPFPEKMRIEEDSQTAQVLNHYLYQERDYLIVARNGKEAIDNKQRQSYSSKTSNSKISKKLKHKLAFISPLPPQQSGIAYYSAELLPELSKLYDIDIISLNSSIDDSWIENALPIRTLEWFKIHHNEYERILYHFGNSAFHIEMIELLENFSGVIVLHDFYLRDLIVKAVKLTSNLYYQQHGYQALFNGKNYPCNQGILNNALGVIVHSEYPKKMLLTWYDKNSSLNNWATVPHLRTPPKADEVLLGKEMLGLPTDAFVVCSFGLLRPNKNNHELLDAWLNSRLHQDSNCYLVFVGDNQQESDYGKKLADHISQHIWITGWVDDVTFKSYLSIADTGVQLRGNSTGETSGTILDCMNYQIPLIINANGSNQELPHNVAIILKDNFKSSDLTQALEQLYNNKNKEREQLSCKAKKLIEQYHAPKKCAQLYQQSIEKHYKNRNAYKILSVKKLSQRITEPQELTQILSRSDFIAIRQKQILIDVSTIIKNDLKTGIERVVRSQIIELVNHAPTHIRIEPVYLATEEEEPDYFYARSYAKNLLGVKEFTLTDEPVKVNSGDIFYGLDLCVREVEQATHSHLYQHYKALGVSITFMVYDLLPITMPHFFPAKMKAIHQQWFAHISQVADQLICISNKVATEVKSHLKESNIEVKSLHLGADITKDNAKKRPRLSLSVNKPITFLMVGTVEPRKMHQEVLEAFETLWQQTENIHLKIVGKQGWMMEDFIKKLSKHPQKNKKLFYLRFISDKELQYLYSSSDCLIVASEDEGFGLPLIEGAKNGIPIIARDIEVFREVAGDYACYFQEEKLTLTIENWLIDYREGKYISSEKMPYLTWREYANNLLKLL